MDIHFDGSVPGPLLQMIVEIEEFKGAWKLVSRLSPDRLATLRRIAAIESIGSSTRIEGSKLSDKEVESLLSNLDPSSFRSRDEEEVAGYQYVSEEVFTQYEHMPFTENVIKQLHSWLLKYSSKDGAHRGEYKKHSNHIEAFDAEGKSLGIICETVSPFLTPGRMEKLVFWVQDALENKQIHPLLAIGIFLVVFLEIHPFLDGNGRLSRVLTTLLLLKAGYHYVPYCSLESLIEENKEAYYLALRKTQASFSKEPDFLPWLTFFLRALLKQKVLLEQKIGRETFIALHLPDLSAKVVELLQEHGKLSIAEMVQLIDANRNTLKKHLQALAQERRIFQHGKGRGTWYTLF